MHFSQKQFEIHRLDRRKLLKHTAVPDLLQKQNRSRGFKNDTGTTKNEPFLRNPEVEFVAVHPVCNSYTTNIDMDNSCSPDRENSLINASVQQSINDLRTNLKKVMRERNAYKKDLDNILDGLHNQYNEDQINYVLHGNARGQIWSEDTMTRAIKLYLSCGKTGYEEIIRQNLPFPSIRIVQHRLRNNQFFNPGTECS